MPAAALVLQTDPTGARVRRDMLDLGNTPLPLTIPRGERWTIEVSASGYETRLVTVEGGQPSLTIHLERDARANRGAAAAPPIQPRPFGQTPTARPFGTRSTGAADPRAPDLNNPWAR
jgi:hypothetical protein